MAQRLLDEVLDCPDLPSLPAVAAMLLERMRDPDASVNDLAEPPSASLDSVRERALSQELRTRQHRGTANMPRNVTAIPREC